MDLTQWSKSKYYVFFGIICGLEFDSPVIEQSGSKLKKKHESKSLSPIHNILIGLNKLNLSIFIENKILFLFIENKIVCLILIISMNNFFLL